MGFQRFEDQDGDAEGHSYAEMRRRVRERATPDERVQRAIVGGLVKKFNDAIFDFEHGIGVINANQIELLGGLIAGTIRLAQEAAAESVRELVGV